MQKWLALATASCERSGKKDKGRGSVATVKKIQRFFYQEQGISALYMALVLSILLGMVGIALDGSNAYVQRRRMQTAADFAALAGARVLALGGDTATIDDEVEALALTNGVGNLAWQTSTDGNSMQAVNSDSGKIDWNYIANNKGILVSVVNNYEPFFSHIFGYDILTSTGRAGAGYLPVVGVRNLIPLAINGCDCVNFNELPAALTQANFVGSVIATYAIDNVSANSITYLLDLRNLDPTYPSNPTNRPYYLFSASEGQGVFTVYSDDTAHAVAQVVNINGDGFAIDFRLSGRTVTPPDAQSPICEGVCPDTSDWHYYPTMTGVLTGLPGTRYADAVIQVTRRGSAVQVGTNAHLKPPQPAYGSAAWLSLAVVQQPSTDRRLNSHSEEATTNMLLLPADEEGEPPDDSNPALSCQLYPIALNTQTLNGAVPGARLGDIWNGVQPGNFGWLTWAGSPNVPTLALSLTPPGNSQLYRNPNLPTDTQLSMGDWVQGSPGVANANAVRAALDVLKTIDITVPVWDQANGNGNNALYKIANFAVIRITDYRLPSQNRITATFVGYATNCGGGSGAPPTTTPIPTATPIATPVPPTARPPCQFAWLDWDGRLASNGELANDLKDPSRSGLRQIGEWVEAGPAVTDVQAVTNALDRWLNQSALIVLYDEGNQQQGYQICGFGAFTLTDYEFAALPPWLQGQFNPTLVRGLTDPNAPDYGVRDLRFK